MVNHLPASIEEEMTTLSAHFKSVVSSVQTLVSSLVASLEIFLLVKFQTHGWGEKLLGKHSGPPQQV